MDSGSASSYPPSSVSSDEPTRVADSRDSSDSGSNTTGARLAAKLRDASSAPPQISGYELLEEVHRGGQGVVYRAMQLGTKRQVALKVLLEGPYASKSARRRFEREVELAASLQHPNIVTILDSGVSSGLYFFAMEFIEGHRLHDYLAAHKCDLDDTLALFQRVSDAVNFAHRRGVIHRDLKPSNILVDADGRPHVLDFGLAKSKQDYDPGRTTIAAVSVTGQVIGTLAYMSPEQAAGSADTDLRSDVYSLGVMLYEALVGDAPYNVKGPLGEVLQRIANDEPRRPRTSAVRGRFPNQIDDELETILRKSLEKDPDRRYQTAGELADDLGRYLAGEAIEAKRASGMYMLRKTLRRYRLQAGMAGVVLVLLVVSLVGYAWRYQTERSLRAEAEAARTQAEENEQAAAAAADRAQAAEARERTARRQAEEEKQRALAAAEDLKRALIRQKIQRADLAWMRGDPSEARDSYWEAYSDDPNSIAALWALRSYYEKSGDAGTAQIFYHSHGPTTLSADGRFAVVPETPRALTLRDLDENGATFWAPLPGELQASSINRAGRIAAGGDGWLRLWDPPRLRPVASANVSAVAGRVRGVYTWGDDGLLMVDDHRVRSYRGNASEPLSVVDLPGEPTGRPEYSELLRAVAIPTSGGVVLVRAGAAGGLTQEVAWEPQAGVMPRAVRFVGYELLAVYADAVYLRYLQFGTGAGEWQRILAPQHDWDFFDLKNSVGTIAFGDRDGRVAIYRGPNRRFEGRLSSGGVQDLRLSIDGEAVTTIDENGVVARWTPPRANDAQRIVHERAALRWAQSANGEATLFADDAGTVYAYAPARDAEPQAVGPTSVWSMVLGRSVEDIGLAIDESGRFGALVYGRKIWVGDLLDGRANTLEWQRLEATDVAIASGGEVLAIRGRGHNEEHLLFLGLDWSDGTIRIRQRPLRPPLALLAGDVLGMQFLPGTRTLVVARGDGGVALIPSDMVPGGASADAFEAWTYLEAPAARMAFDASGRVGAFACEDGFIRLIAMLDTTELGHLNIGKTVTSLAFNPDGTLLLVSTEAGTVRLYDVTSFEHVATLADDDATPRRAVWLADQGVLISDGDVVRQYDYVKADEKIQAGRRFAQCRRVARAIKDYDYDSAWEYAGILAQAASAAGRDARLIVAEELLRRPRSYVSDSLLRTIRDEASDAALLRLAHAAHAGGRYVLAREIMAAAEIPLEALDANSVWVFATASFLSGDIAAARERYEAALVREDLARDQFPTVWLQHALTLAHAGAPLPVGGDGLSPNAPQYGIVDLTMPRAIDLLVELLHDRTRARAREQLGVLTSFGVGVWGEFRDDVELVLGESACIAGDFEAARQHFRRCLDLARSDWTYQWAQRRLEMIAAR